MCPQKVLSAVEASLGAFGLMFPLADLGLSSHIEKLTRARQVSISGVAHRPQSVLEQH